MKKKLFLVRHAQSEYNEKGIFQGGLDSDLTPLGFVQARLVAKELEKENIQLIISSPQRRAYKTALVIGDVLGLNVEVDERLREMSFGVLEGRDFWELYDKERKMMRSWLVNPKDNPLPSQEPVESFRRRIEELLEDVLSREEEVIALVGHGGTLHGLVCLALGLDMDKLWHVHMDNTGVTLLEYDGSFRISYMNRLCHLKGLD